MNIRKLCRLLIIFVIAVGMIGASAMTVSAAAKTPSQVKGLKATGATDTTVSISWNKAANAKKYEVQYKASSAKAWKSQTTTAKKATIKGLKADTKYQFKVRGLNGSKKGKFSKTITQKTFIRPAKVNADSIYATERTKRAISIKWADTKAKNVSWYEVSMRKLTASGSLGVQTPLEPEFDAPYALHANTWYEFKVRAVNAETGKFKALKSAWSAPYYACTTKGDRVITGEKGDHCIKYQLNDTFIVGEDESLISDNLYEIPDPSDTIYETDYMLVDGISFPADLVGEWTDGTSVDLKGQTYCVGDSFDGDTIEQISVYSHEADGQLTGHYEVTFKLSDAYRPSFVW